MSISSLDDLFRRTSRELADFRHNRSDKLFDVSLFPEAEISAFDKILENRLEVIKTVIDDHLAVLVSTESRDKKDAFLKRSPLKKLYLLMANAKKMRQMCLRMAEDKYRNRLRMVSVT